MVTINEIMKELGITDSYDTAKPQPWLDSMKEQGWNYRELSSSIVWLYDKENRIWGRPFNYMAAFAKLLMVKADASHLAWEYKQKMFVIRRADGEFVCGTQDDVDAEKGTVVCSYYFHEQKPHLRTQGSE